MIALQDIIVWNENQKGDGRFFQPSLYFGEFFDPLQNSDQSELSVTSQRSEKTEMDVVWGVHTLGIVCVCSGSVVSWSASYTAMIVWYDHPCFSYSQQITSDLYVGVNPGLTRGRSSRRCICNLSVCEALAVKQLQTQWDNCPFHAWSPKPPQDHSTLIGKPHSLNCGITT